VWSHWFGQQLAHTWVLFAVLLGAGGLVSQSVRGGALFTLSLPVSRGRVLAVRAATALIELAVLALVPTLVVVALSPAIGESYPLGDALIHAACLVIAGSALFALAFALSTVFSDVWRPPLIALLVAVVLGLLDMVPALAPFGVFRVMSADSYFRGDGLPWPGLVASATAAALLLFAAVRNIARQDF
jgi:ABC-type transport system involved in multi-copper enzyme maturation permease subunit